MCFRIATLRYAFFDEGNSRSIRMLLNKHVMLLVTITVNFNHRVLIITIDNNLAAVRFCDSNELVIPSSA